MAAEFKQPQLPYWYAVATWAPNGPCPKAYELPAVHRRSLSHQLPGVPVTVEHAGIEEAVAQIDKAGAPSTKSMLFASLTKVSHDTNAPHKLPVGAVTDSWIAEDGRAECAVVVTSPAIQHLIGMGLLGSVSLTQHEERDKHQKLISASPLEMTVCVLPARPGAKIIHSGLSSDDVAVYKASSVESSYQQPKRSLMMSSLNVQTPVLPPAVPAAGMQPVATPADDMDGIDEAFKAMPEQARKKMATMFQGKLNQFKLLLAAKTKDEATILKLQHELKSKSATTDRDLVFLKRSLATLAAQMPPDVRAMYALDDDSLGDTISDYQSGDRERMAEATLRTVLCASRALQMRPYYPGADGQHSDASNGKRPRVEYTEPPTMSQANHNSGGSGGAAVTPASLPLSERDVLFESLNFSFA